MKKSAIIILLTVLSAPLFHTSAQMDVRFLNEKNDTTKITEILIDIADLPFDNGKTMCQIAESLVGTPYAAHTLEGNPEQLTIGMDEFDCTTFIETVAALAMTKAEHRSSWRDFIYNLRSLRYRGGKVKGYGSRLHYFSDWVVDNFHRGNILEVTDRIAPATYQVKTLDFMSSNRDQYEALADSTNYAAIKNAEIGYRSHRYPFIKSINLSRADLRDGDIIAITTSIKNLDVTHMGILKIIDGVPHLIHASSKAGKVILDPLPLADYLKRQRSATGIRVVRLHQ